MNCLVSNAGSPGLKMSGFYARLALGLSLVWWQNDCQPQPQFPGQQKSKLLHWQFFPKRGRTFWNLFRLFILKLTVSLGWKETVAWAWMCAPFLDSGDRTARKYEHQPKPCRKSESQNKNSFVPRSTGMHGGESLCMPNFIINNYIYFSQFAFCHSESPTP